MINRHKVLLVSTVISACVFTHCSFIQEIVIEVHKVFLGLFGTEVPEVVSMQVAQLWLDGLTDTQILCITKL